MAPIQTKGRQAVPTYQEILAEPVQGATIVVIHAGSLNLRIGRSCDTFPHTVPHVIARRRKRTPYSQPNLADKTSVLVRTVKVGKDVITGMESTVSSLLNILQSCITSEGSARYATPPQQIMQLNRQVRPRMLDTFCEEQWTEVDSGIDYVIGEEALYLNPNEKFTFHWPISRGQLNLHPGIGGSMTAVLQDIEVIWGTAIQRYLDIPLKDFKHYRAVLVVPDILNRQHVKEMVNVLLVRLGFGGCFVTQEAVCATFGAGLSYACVVDVGDQKSSVCCVEDGISLRNTKLCMEYGGSDITQLFYWLVKKCCFPYANCNPSNCMDSLLLQELKEMMCHINLDICGPHARSFHVKCPGKPEVLYNMHLGDECMVAPLGLFNPDLFGLTGAKLTRTQTRSKGDPEDPHDDIYLQETSQRRGVRENLLETGAFNTDAIGQLEDGQLPGSQLDDDIDPADAPVPLTSKETEKEFQCDQLLSIDQAILQSIDRCQSDEVKRKMYSCILVVGGGMMFSGIHTWLQNRLRMQIPVIYRSEQMDIVTRAKDLDPRILTWKGAAIMSCLDSAQELWIRNTDWIKEGVRILRERAPFSW